MKYHCAAVYFISIPFRQDPSILEVVSSILSSRLKAHEYAKWMRKNDHRYSRLELACISLSSSIGHFRGYMWTTGGNETRYSANFTTLEEKSSLFLPRVSMFFPTLNFTHRARVSIQKWHLKKRVYVVTIICRSVMLVVVVSAPSQNKMQ